MPLLIRAGTKLNDVFVIITIMQQEYIPRQEEGTQKDFKAETHFETTEDAEEGFLVAKDRLLHVNNWHHIAEGVSGHFKIKDGHNREVDRAARKGDLIEISIPAGPDHTSGTGNDWVRVEELAYEDFPDQNREFVVMTLRPVSDPHKTENTTSHFFDDKATSSFVVERINNKLIANYHGRNEKPNTDGDGIVDTMRNAIVALGAIVGFSEIQWKGLLQGFIR